MEYKSVKERTFDIEGYIKNSTDINIVMYADYDGMTGVGMYNGVMCYKSHTKYICRRLERMTDSTSVLIVGIYDAIKKVKLHNAKICIVLGNSIGFQSLSRNRSTKHTEELAELVRDAEAEQNTFSSLTVTHGQEIIRHFVDAHRNIATSLVYDKLIRDNIPEIVEKSGKKCVTEKLNDEQYALYLQKKLNEEINEWRKAQTANELADVLEVVYALAKSMGVSEERLNEIRRKKRETNGAFEKRLLLKEVTEDGEEV